MSTLSWVDLETFDLKTNTFSPLVRCVNENGIIRFDGDEAIISNLKTGVVSMMPEEDPILPSDPEGFLQVLTERFTSPNLRATTIQSGDTLPPFQPKS